jgi:hypothetical protein
VFQIINPEKKEKMFKFEEFKEEILRRIHANVSFNETNYRLFTEATTFPEIMLLLKTDFVRYVKEDILRSADFQTYQTVLNNNHIFLNVQNLEHGYMIINQGGLYKISGTSVVVNFAPDAYIESRDYTRIQTHGGYTVGYDETFTEGFGEAVINIKAGARGAAHGNVTMFGKDCTLSAYGASYTMAKGDSIVYGHGKDAHIFVSGPEVTLDFND